MTYNHVTLLDFAWYNHVALQTNKGKCYEKKQSKQTYEYNDKSINVCIKNQQY
jgi:hypothetical protein